MIKYPVYQPSLNGNEKEYLLDCIDSNWISSKGKYVEKFEDSFSKLLGIDHSASVSNGTVALHVSLIALGIGEGDEVIVPTFTYIAAVNAITYTGARPVFVDSDPVTWQMDPKDVRMKVTSKTKAILAVHLYGHPCNMDDLISIKKEHDLFLVEDCAEALGARYKEKLTGLFGDIATFSFYGNKLITTGEGGMVVTKDETLYDRVVHFKGQGLAKRREYWHDVVGYNYRMNNLCAAVGLAQIERFDELFTKKLEIANWYKDFLKDSIYTFHQQDKDVLHSYWMCSILVNSHAQRDKLRGHLRVNGIETRPAFYPIHTMPMYSQKYEKHQVAEDLGWRGINLPSYPDLEYSDVEFITNCLLDYQDKLERVS